MIGIDYSQLVNGRTYTRKPNRKLVLKMKTTNQICIAAEEDKEQLCFSIIDAQVAVFFALTIGRMLEVSFHHIHYVMKLVYSMKITRV